MTATKIPFLASTVFHSGLTKDQSRQIEMVQKKALAKNLANSYTRLDSMRNKLCYNFTVKCAKSHKHKSMFLLSLNPRPNMKRPKTTRRMALSVSSDDSPASFSYLFPYVINGL